MKPLNILMNIPNAGFHNSIYRGKDITDLFYDGTLSKQIAAETFDDIFIGDYIIGKNSNRKYLVADINYRLHTGDTECTTPHILMIPEKVMGTSYMNDSSTSTGAYAESKMRKENLEGFRQTIRNDFYNSHILNHREYFQDAVTDNYASSGNWYDSDIELMNEFMVYGSLIYSPARTNAINSHVETIDSTQLAIFKMRADLIIGFDNTARTGYWLRDVANNMGFAAIGINGLPNAFYSSDWYGVRPAFLVY